MPRYDPASTSVPRHRGCRVKPGVTYPSRAGAGLAGTRAKHHFTHPVDEQRRIGFLPGLFGQGMVSARDHPVGKRLRVGARAHIVLDHRMRHDGIVLRLDDQHIAAKLRASGERAIFLGGHGGLPINSQFITVELPLGYVPVAILVERGCAQRKPADRPQRSGHRGKVAPVAAAHDRDSARVYRRMAHQHVVRGEHVPEIVFAGDALAQALMPDMAAQVEGQADAAERRDLVRPGDVLILAAIPAVHQHHPGHHRVGPDQCAGDVLAVDRDVDRCCHGWASGSTTVYFVNRPTRGSLPRK